MIEEDSIEVVTFDERITKQINPALYSFYNQIYSLNKSKKGKHSSFSFDQLFTVLPQKGIGIFRDASDQMHTTQNIPHILIFNPV